MSHGRLSLKIQIHWHRWMFTSTRHRFIIFAILLILRKFKKFDGQLFWTYTLLYAVGRFIVEIFRGDERGFVTASLSTSQFIAIPLLAISIVMLIKLKKRKIEG